MIMRQIECSAQNVCQKLTYRKHTEVKY